LRKSEDVWGAPERSGELQRGRGRSGELWTGPGSSGEVRGGLGGSGEVREALERSGEPGPALQDMKIRRPKTRKTREIQNKIIKML